MQLDGKDAILIPGSGRMLGRGHGNPIQYSCLENPVDRGAWRTTVHTGSHRVRHDWSDLAAAAATCRSYSFVIKLRRRITVINVLKSQTSNTPYFFFWLFQNYFCLSKHYYQGLPGGSLSGKESACNTRDLGSIPGWRKSPGEGNGNPSSILAWRIP